MKKYIKICLSIILFCTLTSTAKADMIESGFLAGDDRILKCTYSYGEDELSIEYIYKKHWFGKFTHEIEVTKTGETIDIGEAGDQSDEKPTESALNEEEVVNYINQKGICPTYIGEYITRYAWDSDNAIKTKHRFFFADNSDALSGSSIIYKKNRTIYNNNYCYYNYDVKFPEIPTWGVFIKKSMFSNFANQYEGTDCPTTVITELYESLEAKSEFKRGFYASSTNETEVIDNLKQQCKNDAIEQLNGRSTGLKCYAGEKVDLKSDDNPAQNPDFDPTKPLECNALFDQETKKFISMAYFIIEIIAILIAIALTIKDYAVAILNSNADEIKKANKNLITRLIVIIILLLLPSLINLLFKVFNIKAFNSDPLCGTVNK